MKKTSTLKSLILSIILATGFFTANAQTPAPFQGPSDATTAPPTTAAAVAKVICNADVIKLTGTVDGTGTMIYQWYKTNSTNVKTLVKVGTNNDNVYTETSTAAGYYTYELVELNANNCTSVPSDPFKIFVLPALNASIIGNAIICGNNQTTSVLKVTGTDPTNYAYNYQWARNGVDITTNGTTDTYTVSELTAPASVIYSVKVSYVLNTGCVQTPTKTITVDPIPSKPAITFAN